MRPLPHLIYNYSLVSQPLYTFAIGILCNIAMAKVYRCWHARPLPHLLAASMYPMSPRDKMKNIAAKTEATMTAVLS